MPSRPQGISHGNEITSKPLNALSVLGRWQASHERYPDTKHSCTAQRKNHKPVPAIPHSFVPLLSKRSVFHVVRYTAPLPPIWRLECLTNGQTPQLRRPGKPSSMCLWCPRNSCTAKQHLPLESSGWTRTKVSPRGPNLKSQMDV